MRHNFQKDKNLRKVFRYFEGKKIIKKYIIANSGFRVAERNSFLKFQVSNFQTNRIRNFSLFNFRPSSVQRQSCLNRIDFRHFSSWGFVSGIRKSSWLK
jgi:hypothetical protein